MPSSYPVKVECVAQPAEWPINGNVFFIDATNEDGVVVVPEWPPLSEQLLLGAASERVVDSLSLWYRVHIRSAGESGRAVRLHTHIQSKESA